MLLLRRSGAGRNSDSISEKQYPKAGRGVEYAGPRLARGGGEGSTASTLYSALRRAIMRSISPASWKASAAAAAGGAGLRSSSSSCTVASLSAARRTHDALLTCRRAGCWPSLLRRFGAEARTRTVTSISGTWCWGDAAVWLEDLYRSARVWEMRTDDPVLQGLQFELRFVRCRQYPVLRCCGAEMLRMRATGFCLQDVVWRWRCDS